MHCVGPLRDCQIFIGYSNIKKITPQLGQLMLYAKSHHGVTWILLKFVLDREAAAEHTESRFISPLHGAAFKEHTEFLRLLIDCDVNEPLSFIFLGFQTLRLISITLISWKHVIISEKLWFITCKQMLNQCEVNFHWQEISF